MRQSYVVLLTPVQSGETEVTEKNIIIIQEFSFGILDSVAVTTSKRGKDQEVKPL